MLLSAAWTGQAILSFRDRRVRCLQPLSGTFNAGFRQPAPPGCISSAQASASTRRLRCQLLSQGGQYFFRKSRVARHGCASENQCPHHAAEGHDSLGAPGLVITLEHAHKTLDIAFHPLRKHLRHFGSCSGSICGQCRSRATLSRVVAVGCGKIAMHQCTEAVCRCGVGL